MATVKQDITEEQKKQPKKIEDNRLIIGENDKGKELFIPEKSRFLNTLVLGTKGTGKTTGVLPMFVEQDLKRKNAGVTVITSSKEMSYNIYSLAKKYKRKIHFLKPSINNEITNKFLWTPTYSYDYINEYIINYKEAIKKKEVVIIDMEVLKYKGDALRSVAMLLLQLRLDIQETDVTQRCHHFLHVDDAQYYLKFLEDLLLCSDTYNLGITLYMQSRKQLITKNHDYDSLVTNNVRNNLLLNNISTEDYEYYSKKFYEKASYNDFYNRELKTMLYETVDNMGVRRIGVSKFKKFLICDWEELESNSKRIRAKLLKEKRKMREAELKAQYQKSLDSSSNNKADTPALMHEPKPIDTKLLDFLKINIPEPSIAKQPTIPQKEEGKHIPQAKETKSQNGALKHPNAIEKEQNKEPVTSSTQKDSNPTNTTSLSEKKQDTMDTPETKKPDLESKPPKDVNPIELQKKKEEEELQRQKEMEKKIQEQIFNEEKERKRVVATRIFNNYNETIDYCDEVFDFKYE